jgi:ABC-type spermidine/putrescine transport system permease subunit II
MSTPAGTGQGGTPLSEGQYEFNAEENMRIERAGASYSIWAVCAMVGALLLGTLAGLQVYLHNVRGAVLVLPLFLVCAVAGWLYLGSGRALKQVVSTQGNDVELLMRALDRLSRAFRYEVIATIVALLVFVALAVATRM